MFLYRYAPLSLRWIFSIVVCSIRTLNVNLPVIDHLPNFAMEHWTSPTVIEDNLSITASLCHYGALSFHTPTMPGQLQLKHKLSSNLISTSLLLLLAGDIASNPGPCPSRKPKNPCVHCCKGVTARSKAVSCDGCERWVHIRCTNTISNATYDRLVEEGSEVDFICNCCCFQLLPFVDFGDLPENINVNLDPPLPSVTDLA